MKFKQTILIVCICCLHFHLYSQISQLKGIVSSNGKPLSFIKVQLKTTTFGAITDESGHFEMNSIPVGSYEIVINAIDYEPYHKMVELNQNEHPPIIIELKESLKILEEVVVTGVTKATKLRENPLSISLISPKQLQTAAGSNIIDNLVQHVPGLSAVKTGPNISKPFIHGLGYNRVLTLYDGIRQEGQQWGDEHGLEVDQYNIEQAEVIKGPASLMYGSDAIAGIISLFPALPKADDNKIHGQFTSEYHSNNHLIGNGLRINYRNNHFITAVRGSFRMAQNYRNPIDGPVYLSNFNEKNTSVLLGYQSTKGFTHFNLTYYDNRQGIPDGNRDSLSRKFTQQVNEGILDNPNNRPIVAKKELHSYRISTLSQHIQHFRAYVVNDYELKAGQINAILGFQQNQRREYTHPTQPKQAGLFVQLNTLNYQFRYSLPSIRNIDISVGLNGMLQTNKNKNATDFPIPDYQLADGGMFVYGKWKRNNWTISGGVRYDIRRIQWDDFYLQKDATTGFMKQVNSMQNGTLLQFENFQKVLQGFSASIGGTYWASKHISIKANIGRAYRAPNITELASNGLDPGAHIIYLGNRTFKPEFALQEDLGVTGKFRDFTFDMSIFNNHIQGFIYLTMAVDSLNNPLKDGHGNSTYQYQQSKAQLFGGEISVQIHPNRLKGFHFQSAISMVYGLNKNELYRNKGNQGEYLPLIPPLKWLSRISHTFNLSTKKGIIITPSVELEYQARQNRYLGLNKTETATAAFLLVHPGINLEIPTSKTPPIQVIVQATNVLNTAYQSHLNRLKYFENYQQSPKGKLGIYNMGRNISIKLIVPF